MTAPALRESSIPAFPLGQPLDGRKRYGMTPQQARLYRWLVKSRPHHIPFQMHFRDAALALGTGVGSLHYCLMELVDRGWVSNTGAGAHAQYQMVPPVMTFKVPTEISGAE
jgi:hypothetical protein